MTDEADELTKHAHLVEDAVARGQAALAAGERSEAARWLDRAHRLAPADGTILLLLASVAIGDDNPKAAELFAQVLVSADVLDAWLGLATARFLLRDFTAAGAALTELLSRHALRPDVAALADQVARATGAPGWCGLMAGENVLAVSLASPGKVAASVDGKPIGDPRPSRPSIGRDQAPPRHPDLARPGHDDRVGTQSRLTLPPAWPRARHAMVTTGDRNLLGSPISLRTIARVEGHVEAWDEGLCGWAWCPGDKDADPRLSVHVGGIRHNLVVTETVDIPGLVPLARPRAFAIAWAELPAGREPMRVRGRDGRELPGSPVERPDKDTIRDLSGAPPSPQAQCDCAVAPARRPGMRQWRGNGTKAVILVTHSDGGGVERRIQSAVAFHTGRGRRAITLRPSNPPDGAVVVEAPGLPNLRFELPREQTALLRLLRGAEPVEAELHHFLNHDPCVFPIIRALGVPYDAHTHDYAWFCQRVALVGRGDRYCGEPAAAACQACVTEIGSFLREDIRVAALLERSRDILFGARRVIAPSRDAAARMTRHFPGLTPVIIPHEDDGALAEPPPIPRVAGTVRVCVAGAIGLHKGFHVLLACARDARDRALDLTFVVAGLTIDDQTLLDTGRVFVTGPYKAEEAVGLIREQTAHLAFLPSIWPETWSLGLTELWRAGLRVAAFDIGTPAERIRRTGRGFLLPLGLSPQQINDALLNVARGRSLLPIRRSSAYKPSH